MLERSSTLAWIEQLQDVNSISGLLDAFDVIALESDIDGFALSRAVPGAGTSLARIDHAGATPMIHVEGEHIVASHTVTHRVVSTSGVIFWVPTSEAPRDLDCPDADVHADRTLRITGLTVPTRMADGEYGSVSMLSSRREPQGEDLVLLVMMAVALHGRVERIDQLSANAAELSLREHQVIAWLAQGKSADDVASILGISSATVMFHYRNVAAKFGTLNRTHTVVEAFRRGELHLGEGQVLPRIPPEGYTI